MSITSNEQPARKWSKRIIASVVGIGTTTIVKQTIANNVQKSGIGYITVPVAGFVISAMFADQTKAYTNRSIDAFFDQLEELGIIEVTEAEIDVPA